MTNDVELAAETEPHRWGHVLLKEGRHPHVDTRPDAPGRRVRPRQKSSRKPRALDSVPTPELALWAESWPSLPPPGTVGVRPKAAVAFETRTLFVDLQVP
jgi:hypothetical protein